MASLPAPELSVIVTTFNPDPQALDECLRSVVAQQGRSLEVLIVDDCSRTPIASLVAPDLRADARVRILTLEANSGGPARPRNKGIENALGRYVSFLDCDDVWTEGKVQHDLTLLETLDAAAISSAKIRFEAGTPPPLTRVAIRNRLTVRRVGFLRLLVKNPYNLSTVTVRKDALSGIAFSEEKALSAVEDYHLWLKLALRGRTLVVSNAVTMNYRLSPASLSASKRRMMTKVRRVQKDVFPNRALFSLLYPFLLSSYFVLSLLDRAFAAEHWYKLGRTSVR